MRFMSYIYTVRRKPKDGKVLPPEFKGKVKLDSNKNWIKKEKAPRKTYPQDWHLYNKYQTNEKLMFYKILDEVVRFLNIDEKYGHVGRPYHLMSDMIKACCVKVFCGLSSRRVISELKLFQKLGYIKHVPHYNSLVNYFNDSEMEKHLTNLYGTLTFPLRNIERVFTVDSTGLSISGKTDWATVRLEDSKQYDHKIWKKLHVIVGVATKIIAFATITKGYANDSPEFITLLDGASKNFHISEVSADSAYLSRKNVDHVCKLGGVPYIMLKSNTTGKARGSYNFMRMCKFSKENPEEFGKHYHKRSNSETTFSMFKRKFSDRLRNKKNQAQRNELLCLVVCHNISVLVEAFFELDLDLNWN